MSEVLLTQQKPTQGHQQRGITKVAITHDLPFATKKMLRDIAYSFRRTGDDTCSDSVALDRAIRWYYQALIDRDFPMQAMPDELVAARRRRGLRTSEGIKSRKADATVTTAEPAWKKMV
jgi:hypothetical protein